MPSTRRRLLTGFLFAGALGWLAIFAATFLAEAYGRLGTEQRSQGESTLVALSAGHHAVRLQPWRLNFRSDLAWAYGLRGDTQMMRNQYRSALRWNPANAYLWIEYAQALARARHIDQEYTLALKRGVTLSHAQPMALLAARMGANHWSEGGLNDRTLWASSMTAALRSAPLDFLWHVVRARREGPLCGYVGKELGLTHWCTAVMGAREVCDGLDPAAQGPAADQCRHLGLLEVPDDSGTVP